MTEQKEAKIEDLKKQIEDIYGILQFYKDLALNLFEEIGVLDAAK